MKYFSLQILRGFAAWLVVFHHYVYIFYILNHKRPGIIGDYFWNFGAFGVDVFFVLSGFIMYASLQKRSQNGIQYFFNRVLRIMPLYWTYLIILLLLTILFNKEIFFSNYNFETLFKSILLIPHKNLNGSGYYPILYVGWTLTYEMFFYFILAFSIFLNKSKALSYCSVALIIIPIVSYYFHLTLFGNNKFLLWEFVSGIFIGYLINYYKNKIEKNLIFFSWLIVLLIPVFLFILGWSFYSKFLIASLIVLFFILNDNKNAQVNGFIKFLVKLGDYSFSTYLSHIIVIGVFLYFFKDKVDNGIIEIIVLILISIIVYMVSMLTFNFIENGKWVSNLKKRINTLK